MKVFKKGDVVIIFLIITISILPLFIIRDKKIKDAKIVVSQDSKIIATYPLNKTEKSQFKDFYFESNGKKYKGTLETKNSKVRLLRLPEEAVPKPIHSDMDFIENENKIIVALPARLVVSIQSDDKNDQIDTISS